MGLSRVPVASSNPLACESARAPASGVFTIRQSADFLFHASPDIRGFPVSIGTIVI
jgi:hypothetical protein